MDGLSLPVQVISPMKDGTVADWDIVDNIWNHALR
jgi:actin-like protein 6A